MEGVLSEFLARAVKGMIERGTLLIVESMDRLSRDELQPAVRLLLKILDSGLLLGIITEDKIYSQINYNDFLMIVGDMVRSHKESEVKSTRS